MFKPFGLGDNMPFVIPSIHVQALRAYVQLSYRLIVLQSYSLTVLTTAPVECAFPAVIL